MNTLKVEYAGFWRRGISTLLDITLLSLVLMPLAIAFFQPNFFAEKESLQLSTTIILELLSCLIFISCWHYWKATPAKLLLECDVVDSRTGEPLSFGQSILRYVGYGLALLPFGLGIFWILFDKRHQGWHDKLAHSIVIVHDESSTSLQELEKRVN